MSCVEVVPSEPAFWSTDSVTATAVDASAPAFTAAPISWFLPRADPNLPVPVGTATGGAQQSLRVRPPLDVLPKLPEKVTAPPVIVTVTVPVATPQEHNAEQQAPALATPVIDV